MKAFIDKTKCASDNRICMPIKQCPSGAISWVEDDDEPLGSRMEVDIDKCNGCGICVDLCCGHCIELR
jgi:Indolepyruvate ferredoxin oxidoreductase, alpha and beta subunits